MKLKRVAFLSLILGVILAMISAIIIIIDSSFDFYWHLNKFTGMTILIGFSYFFIGLAYGIIIQKKQSK